MNTAKMRKDLKFDLSAMAPDTMEVERAESASW